MRTRAIASLLLAVLCSCGVVPTSDDDDSDDDEGSGSTEDHLDMLDIANSWTSVADPKNPDVAGPIWFASSMTLRGPSLSVRAVASGRPREPVGVFSKDGGFAETGSFVLTPGHYGVLVQYKENDDNVEGASLGAVTMFDYADVMRDGAAHATPMGQKTLGAITATKANPIGSGGWRRVYLRFEIAAGASASAIHRLHIDNKFSGVEWQFGVVALHREGRPFYGIAHNPDSVERLDQALAQGANALEPDFRPSSDNPGITTAEDGFVAVTEQGLTGKASKSNGQATLTTYLERLKAVAPKKLIIWDGKTGSADDYAGVAESIKRTGARVGFDFSHSVFNISSDKMVPLFKPFESVPTAGRCYDGIFTQVHSHNAEDWMGPVRQNRLTFQGLGVTPQLQVTEKWSVPISVYVRAREQEAFPNKIYFWTVNDANAMRRVLDLGIDGLITDELVRLRDVLREEPYASMYRYADDSDDHSTKHGGSWFHVASSAHVDAR
jgi:Glycerophosphoryl diester phosphodiesterase family